MHESLFSNNLKSIEELLANQNFFLDILLRIKTYLIQNDSLDMLEIGWSVVVNILRRGEFNLEHLNFN
jgi:hypothetical protein